MVAITAIAPHMAIESIAASTRGLVVNVLDAVPDVLNHAGLERVAIFGNRAVMDTNIFGGVDAAAVVALTSSAMDSVSTVYDDIAVSGKRGTRAEVDQLAGFAQQALDDGAQAILLAGTDFSSFYSVTPPEYPYLDLASVHFDQIMTQLCSVAPTPGWS